MSDAIITAIELVSFVVIIIILAVVANTVAMSVRERTNEYAIFKTLGFGGWRIAGLILGESIVITMMGCAFGIAVTYPAAEAFGKAMGAYFPVFHVSPETILLDIIFSLVCRYPGGSDTDIPHDEAQHCRRPEDGGMRGIPFAYSLRNLWTRRLTTILTISGMALVVFVFTTILMLAQGLQKTLVETGSYDNAVIIRKGSGSEVQSWVDRAQAGTIETDPLVATGSDGKPLVARELVVLIGLPKKDTEKVSNVTIRGISEASLALRPQVSLVRGRMPKMGSSEVIVGSSVARRFKGADLGGELRFGMRQWTIVGIFDAGNTGFTSEIWGDVEQLMPAFRRPVFSSMILRMNDPSQFEMLKTRIETNPRLTQEVKRETRYYLEQSEMMAKFLRILGISLTLIFSLGAIIGAMITMYAAVANRIGEIGTLRALGFRRTSILICFSHGGASAWGSPAALQDSSSPRSCSFVTVSTVNFQTFSELAFRFSMTFGIAVKGVFFAVVMGFMGGFLPALRAAHMNIVEALRTK